MGISKEGKSGAPFNFAAINPYIERNIIQPTERTLSGKDFVEWGYRNGYPDYLYSLYNDVSTLRSVINGSVDYVCGNSVELSVPLVPGGVVNSKKSTIEDLVQELALSYFTYGGFAIQVIRNEAGDVAELYAVDFRHLRSDKENECFFYSEEWDKNKGKVLVYPKFVREMRDHDSSILYVKNTTTSTYPSPLYAASVKECEIERSIADYHLNSLDNGFMGSYLVNFNNGVPEEEQQEEIARNFQEKFAGKSNAGRIVFAWNDDKDHAVTLDKMEVADYGDRYETLVKHCRQAIFTAFRANPNLFGIPTENLGFSSEEYESTFKLYNRTQIQPVQKRICRAMDKIFGISDTLTITPFSL